MILSLFFHSGSNVFIESLFNVCRNLFWLWEVFIIVIFVNFWLDSWNVFCGEVLCSCSTYFIEITFKIKMVSIIRHLLIYNQASMGLYFTVYSHTHYLCQLCKLPQIKGKYFDHCNLFLVFFKFWCRNSSVNTLFQGIHNNRL